MYEYMSDCGLLCALEISLCLVSAYKREGSNDHDKDTRETKRNGIADDKKNAKTTTTTITTATATTSNTMY